MSRLELRQLGKVHIASFVDSGFAVRAVGGELVAEVRQPRMGFRYVTGRCLGQHRNVYIGYVTDRMYIGYVTDRMYIGYVTTTEMPTNGLTNAERQAARR